MTTESILGVIQGLQGGAGAFTTPRRYDVIFTDRRIVAVATANLAGYILAGGVVGGVVGGLLADAAVSTGSTKGEHSYDPSQLDRLLEAKGSFEIPYTTWQKAWYYGLFGNLLTIKAGGHRYHFKVPKPVRENMSALIYEAETRKGK